MSCPSSIYTALSNYTVTGGEQGPFGTVVRRFGQLCQLDGQGINLLAPGYYDVDASLSFEPTSTGPVTISFYKDGAEIPGAFAVAQGTASEPCNLSVVAKVRNCGCDCNSTLTYTISAAGTVINLATRVDKL